MSRNKERRNSGIQKKAEIKQITWDKITIEKKTMEEIN